MQIELFTSVMPHRHVPSCIDSWRAAGFHVVSVNNASEAAAVRDLGIEVAEFDGADSRPKISTIMRAIDARGSSVAGIINSDCQMLSGVCAETIAAKAPGSLIMSQRINLDRLNLPLGVTTFGFDAFFFDPRLLTFLSSDDLFSIGQPWWDYWFPIAAHQNGMDLLILATPILLHAEHEERWDDDEWVKGCSMFMNSVRQHNLPFSTSGSEIQVSKACYAWLCERPKLRVLPSDVTSLIDGLVERIRLMSDERLRFESSLSWKITAPIRVFRDSKLAKAVATRSRL